MSLELTPLQVGNFQKVVKLEENFRMSSHGRYVGRGEYDYPMFSGDFPLGGMNMIDRGAQYSAVKTAVLDAGLTIDEFKHLSGVLTMVRSELKDGINLNDEHHREALAGMLNFYDSGFKLTACRRAETERSLVGLLNLRLSQKNAQKHPVFLDSPMIREVTDVAVASKIPVVNVVKEWLRTGNEAAKLIFSVVYDRR